ncbi:MAG: methyltransferase domain-containing protein [Actinomycetota bacterium]
MNAVDEHYRQDALLSRIEAGLAAAGVTGPLSVEALAPVDEFHTGGRPATEHVLDHLDLHANDRVLDVGCGIGGAARLCAERHGCEVVGVDLTESFVATAQALTERVGLADRVQFLTADATALDPGLIGDGFAAAYQLHVGMNIADKAAHLTGLANAVRPGGRIGIYDLMLTDTGSLDDLDHPLPWVSEAAENMIAPVGAYHDAVAAAGLDLHLVDDRSEPVMAAMLAAQAASADSGGPPPLGVHLLMGDTAGLKFANMMAAFRAGRIAPVLIVAMRR